MDANARHQELPARVLLVVDRPVLAEVIKLALNHGRFGTRVAQSATEAAAALADWRPHLAVVDMDVGDGAILDGLGYEAADEARIPVLALTRRGDLRTKLAAFERGVDDVVTVPFSPEELVARVLVIARRTHGAAAAL